MYASMYVYMYICIYKYLADIACAFSSLAGSPLLTSLPRHHSYFSRKKFSLMVSMKGCCCCLFELDVFTCKDVVDVDIDDDVEKK